MKRHDQLSETEKNLRGCTLAACVIGFCTIAVFVLSRFVDAAWVWISLGELIF